MAESLYGKWGKNLITINMSEYQEKLTVMCLPVKVHASQGKYGYGEGGVLYRGGSSSSYTV